MINEKQAFKKLLNYCLSNQEEFYKSKNLQNKLSNALHYLAHYGGKISQKDKQLFHQAKEILSKANSHRTLIKNTEFNNLSCVTKLHIIRTYIRAGKYIEAYNLLQYLKMPSHETSFKTDIRNAITKKIQASKQIESISKIINITPNPLRPIIFEIYEKKFFESDEISECVTDLEGFLKICEELNEYKKIYSNSSTYNLIKFLSQATKLYDTPQDLEKIVKLCPLEEQTDFILDNIIQPLLKDNKFAKAEIILDAFQNSSENKIYKEDLKKIDELIQNSINKYVLSVLNKNYSKQNISLIKDNISTKRFENVIALIISNLLQEKPQGFTNNIFKLLKEIKSAELIKITNSEIESKISEYIESIFRSRTLNVLEKQILPKILQFPEPYKSKFVQQYNDLYNLHSCLESHDFLNADELYYKNTDLILKQNYLQIKSKSIKNYFSKILNIDINEEQAYAISSIAQNTLLTARAGSGKTRTIACRAIYAIEKENLKPDEILVLAFNTKAAEETRIRIKEDFQYSTFLDSASRTFHSLAYSIEKPTEDILLDNCNSEYEQKLSNFISELYHSPKIWTADFKLLMYQYFYNDMKQEVIEHWQFTSKQDRYEYYRNMRKFTLQGELVKSNGEKWIADFLFEHGIPYYYEVQFTSSKDGIYRPDFTINFNDSKILLEHWGIDEYDTSQKVPAYWTKTWQEYKNEMTWKRKLCKDKEQILIETSVTDLNEGRKHFEEILKKKLEKHNIICTKIPFEKLIDILDSKYKDEMAKKFATFIQAAHKCKLSASDILGIYKNYYLSRRAEAFIELAVKVYEAFEKEVVKQHKIDFDNMFLRAIKKASNTKCECEIKLGSKSQALKKFKLLLIDEYQDFSDMFYELLHEMKKCNPRLQLFCVGDDWQAINGFAGASLEYFNNYCTIFKNSDQCNLTTNYRSGNEIVQCGNKIMQNRGEPAICHNLNIKSKLLKAYIDNVTIFNENKELDSEFIYDNSNYFNINHRYFKICYSIIKDNPQKSYLIMHRKLKLAGNFELSEFKEALLNKLKKDKVPFKKENLEVNTIHKFKGKEADIAIILECDSENIPLIHPDNEIQIIFGKTPQDILDEERRLFYVAVTRARECVYFLSEKGKEMDFVKNNENIKLIKIG